MKKILIIAIFTLLLLGIGQNCWAQQKLILDYPPIVGAQIPETDTPIPELIRYIYLFALGIVGFVALLSMMIAAVLYVTSAGNPSKMGDAKDRIMSAVLGIIILLASVLLLKTISPNLVEFNLTLPPPEGDPGYIDPPPGETEWYCYGCCNPYPYLQCNPMGNDGGCVSLGTMPVNQTRDLCLNKVKDECGIKGFLYGSNSQVSSIPCP